MTGRACRDSRIKTKKMNEEIKIGIFVVFNIFYILAFWFIYIFRFIKILPLNELTTKLALTWFEVSSNLQQVKTGFLACLIIKKMLINILTDFIYFMFFYIIVTIQAEFYE